MTLTGLRIKIQLGRLAIRYDSKDVLMAVLTMVLMMVLTTVRMMVLIMVFYDGFEGHDARYEADDKCHRWLRPWWTIVFPRNWV